MFTNRFRLRESCRRSNNSVRRDRVFSRYTERCGNERVPTLNPASFGKLVRIIFPNVQTRRLGVRGESKYHYVDLSLFPDDGEQYPPTYHQPMPEERPARQNPSETVNNSYQTHMKTVSMPQNVVRQSTETADFPAPSSAFLPRPTEEVSQPRQKGRQAASISMDCQYLNTPTIRIPTIGMPSLLVAALPSIRSNLPATLSTYLAMPSTKSRTLTPPNSQDSPIELPDIHSYLAGINYDFSIANSLSHLYRSYCIDVIDAFRKCKEKPFFNHHSAFNGKMTVPVAKLFALEQLAPWIHECDMRMYKQMVRFLAPLALQNVPDAVWSVFDRVSTRLVSHLVAAFDEKCATHVVIAKIVPAARFANLLKKLKNVNTGAVQIATMFGDENMRTQMWVDLVAIVDPERVIDESLPPPDGLDAVEGMLSSDMKMLLSPMSDPAVKVVEEDPSNSYANFISEYPGKAGVIQASSIDDPAAGPLDRWIQWLERLPQAFNSHHPQCMVNWHNGFWKSILTQLALGGAPSYQAWYFMEPFMTSMLRWMTQMEGMLLDEEAQKELEDREQAKRKQQEDSVAMEINDIQSAMKRKRSAEDVGGEARSRNGSQATEKPTQSRHEKADMSQYPPSKSPAGLGLDGATDSNDHDNDDDDRMDEIRRPGPLDLPSINTNSSPLKRQGGLHSSQVHDDSGIDLGLDIEDGNVSGVEEHLKRMKRESWILSDPVDADGHVVVI
jgi:regulatory factor X, other